MVGLVRPYLTSYYITLLGYNLSYIIKVEFFLFHESGIKKIEKTSRVLKAHEAWLMHPFSPPYIW